MTIEEAIQILDPETRREALRGIPVMERIGADQAACRIAVAALRAQQAPDNAPLTLEELREMDGEPVWVRDHCSGACICRVIVSSNEHFTHFSDGGLCENKSYKTYWTAYRRKPEEGTS